MRCLVLLLLLIASTGWCQTGMSPAMELDKNESLQIYWSVGNVVGPLSNNFVMLVPSNIELDQSGFENSEIKKEFAIYPNPVTSFVNIEGEGISDIRVYDVHGKIQMVRVIKNSAENYSINFTESVPGLYFVNLQINSEQVRWKILVK